MPMGGIVGRIPGEECARRSIPSNASRSPTARVPRAVVWAISVWTLLASCCTSQNVKEPQAGPSGTTDGTKHAPMAGQGCITSGSDEKGRRCSDLRGSQSAPIESASRPDTQSELDRPEVENPGVDNLVGLPGNDERRVIYSRKQWRHWTDDDRDCQDTRNEVLIAESEVHVTFKDRRRCKVTTGRWTCPYTGKVITDPRRLDVDHLVPLGNAARSGGQVWNTARKRIYANDLEDPQQLIAVDASANRAKGDRGPEEWLPPVLAYRCIYLHDWVAVKKRWGLGVSPRERAVLASGLAACGARGSSMRGSTSPLAGFSEQEVAVHATAKLGLPLGSLSPSTKTACTRVCKSGCPCGDSCISCSRRCKRRKGAACSSGDP